MARYNPEDHSPNPAEFQRLIETSRTLAQAGNPKAAMDVARSATFFASNKDEVDQANGEADAHSNTWASQRKGRRESRQQAETTAGPEATVTEKPKRGRGRKTAQGAEAERQENIASTIAKYSYFKLLVETNPDLAGFFEEIKKVINASPTGTITQDEFNNLTRGYDWFERYDSDQQQAEIAKALDRQNNTNLYEESIRDNKTNIAYTARQKGIELDDATLTELAELARFNNWSAVEIDNAIGQEVVELISTGGTAVGEAGRVQTDLMQWANKNGLNLTDAEVARYVESGAFGGRDLESIKQNIRETYLAGAFPAWSDRIAAGADPADIAAPYRQKIANLLELDEEQVSLSDSLLQRGLQSVGQDGKPRIMPLYEFEQEIRKDPRWQYTDNAYKTYTDVGTDLLKMFGFR